MDPDEALRRIREIVKRVNENDNFESDVPELGNLVQALDEWLTKGGFLPALWHRKK